MTLDPPAPRRPRRGLWLLALASCGATLCLIVPTEVAAWGFALAAAVLPVLVLALGLGPGARPGVGLTVVLLGLLLVAATVAILFLSTSAEELRLGSLPLSLLVMLLGLWLVPFLVTSWGYSAGFDEDALREENLERLRRLGREQAEKEGRPWRS